MEFTRSSVRQWSPEIIARFLNSECDGCKAAVVDLVLDLDEKTKLSFSGETQYSFSVEGRIVHYTLKGVGWCAPLAAVEDAAGVYYLNGRWHDVWGPDWGSRVG